MTDDIQRIIDNLNQTKVNLGKAKNQINKWSDELGYQEELSNLQSQLWEELKIEPPNFSSNITASGASLSQSMLDNSNEILRQIQDNGIEPLITTSGTASEVMGGVSYSAFTYSVNNIKPTQSYINLDKVLSQRNQESVIAQRLGEIDPFLKEEYENAWRGFYMTIDDKTRSPMFLMREVIRGLYDHYAPDDEVMKLYKILEKKDVHRADKINYIASIIDTSKKQIFLEEEKAFNSVYGDLSKAHKDGRLNVDETKGILYQANGLIKLLLDSLEVNL